MIGKAREIYIQLGVEQSHHYETVKELILKGYELVPEAYRQKFRNCTKDSNQTHVEFARNKEQLFDRWSFSKKIDQNYDKLRQLMLVEEFKRCIQSDVKTFLDEKQVETLEEVARLADDYYLTHKVSFIAKPKPTSSHPQNKFIPQLRPQSSVKTNTIDIFTKLKSDSTTEIFEPFMLNGFVSLSGDSCPPTPIKILRDTAASQSLI